MAVVMSTLADLFAAPQADAHYLLRGWLRHKRQSTKVFFLVLTDGSTQATLQAVGDPAAFPETLLRQLTVGTSLAVSGKLAPTPGAAQSYELHLQDIEILGTADARSYPLQPKTHSYAFLRSIAHLRPRTATFGAVFRLRHAASYAIHHFFHQAGFYSVHTPIISATDAEGAGEMFGLQVAHDPGATAFFGHPAYLTVSGQLEAELLAMGLSKVYTFGPTFRAENSNTTRHLSEFWMVEPEAAFYELQDCITLAGELLQAVLTHVLTHCPEELSFLEQQHAKQQAKLPTAARSAAPLLQQLQQLSTQQIPQITYSEAFNLLLQSKPNRKGKFAYPIRNWGQDLQAEHEHYLVQHYEGPVVVKDFPAETKAFYMRLNEDEKTVAAMDLLLPRIGEIAGGSQREERLDKLVARMQAAGMHTKDMEWYLDSRRYGTVPHSGFGLGFERLMQVITGMDNIRDVIPFPRSPGQLKH